MVIFLALKSQDCHAAMPNFHLKDSSLTFLVMVKIINTHPSSYTSAGKHKTKIDDLTRFSRAKTGR